MEGDKAMECLYQMKNLRGGKSFGSQINHTDGGGQYRSDDYLNWLDSKKIKTSQSETCLQNGCAEQFNCVVKNDYLGNYGVRNERDLQIARVINKNSSNPSLH
ncbi:MAG: hypothetical protein V3V00_02505 [Saprospiraceae bacterium]